MLCFVRGLVFIRRQHCPTLDITNLGESRRYISKTMPRGVKKENLPSKICVICNRPYSWRKKWEKCWEDVTTCSKSCNRKRRQGPSAGQRGNAAGTAGTKSDVDEDDDEHDNCQKKNDYDVSYSCNNDNRSEMESLTEEFGSMTTHNEDVNADACVPSSAATHKNNANGNNNNNNNSSTIQKLAMIVTLAGTNAEAFSSASTSSNVLSTTNNAHQTSSSVTSNTALFHGDFSKESHKDKNVVETIDPNEFLHMVTADNVSSNDDDDYNDDDYVNTGSVTNVDDAKARRKAEKKQKKAERRAQRQGTGDPAIGQKACTICNKSVDLLIRCTYDASAEWVSGYTTILDCIRCESLTYSLAIYLISHCLSRLMFICQQNNRVWYVANAGRT